MEIGDYRSKIDALDNELVRLYLERMALAGEIGEYKKEHSLPVGDKLREDELINRLADRAGEKDEIGVRALYSMILTQSRARQSEIVYPQSELVHRLGEAVSVTDNMFPEKAVVACQGANGAYSQTAAEKLFKYPSLMFVSSFESVFSALDKGLCRYGVLPLENSTAGSVTKIYELMAKYNFYIVRSVRVRVSHVLAAPKGAKLSDIREVYSHEQAITQCARFLGSLDNVKLIPCENTAVAARQIAQSDDINAAAICSRDCAEIYGLGVLRDGISDEDENYTRFICVSKKLEIYPGADKTSVMSVLPHKAGSLYRALSGMYARGINLDKLESRPIPDRLFEFMFYFDIDESVYSPALLELLGELERDAIEFRYLGSYSEVI